MTPPTGDSGFRYKSPWPPILIALATVLGAVLRLEQLPGQILRGDEWHAIHAALQWNTLHLLTHFGPSGHAIPDALYARLLLHTVGLSEWLMRLPVLLAGIALIPIGARVIRPYTEDCARVVFAWLLAFSPLLIFYSRFARPYGLITLTTLCAVVIFHRWMAQPRPHLLAAYIALTTITLWVHIIAAPFVLLPLAWCAFAPARGRSLTLAASLRRTAKIAVLTIAPSVLLLAAPFLNSFGEISSKTAGPATPFSTLLKAWMVLLGTRSWVLLLSMGVLIGLGMIFMRQRGRGGFLYYLLFLASAQIAAVWAMHLVASEGEHIFARYAIFTAPVFLLLAAEGCSFLWTFWRRALATMAIAAFCICTAASSRPVWAVFPDNTVDLHYLAFLLHGSNYQSESLNQMVKEVPAFYRELAKSGPDALRIAEVPYVWNWHHVYLYQDLHRQSILMGLTQGCFGADPNVERPAAASSGTRFRNFFFVDDIAAPAARGVDLVIFHKNLFAEAAHPPEQRAPDVGRFIVMYRGAFGPPVYDDDLLTVFSVRGGKPQGWTAAWPPKP